MFLAGKVAERRDARTGTEEADVGGESLSPFLEKVVHLGPGRTAGPSRPSGPRWMWTRGLVLSRLLRLIETVQDSVGHKRHFSSVAFIKRVGHVTRWCWVGGGGGSVAWKPET